MTTVRELRQEKVIFVEDENAFLVSFGGELLALSADAQHLGDDVEYCPQARLFESPGHGEKFDIRGYYFGGPAERGLDRYPVAIHEGWIYVLFDHPIEGPPRDAGPPLPPIGPLCLPT